MTTFTEHAPAPDIRELLQYLSDDEPERYLFRGQPRDFPAAIPSIYRAAVQEGTRDHPVVGLDPERFHEQLTERTDRRFRLLNGLITALGKGIGNIVGQQYGLGSEALDLTSDPVIAAFFATREYPSYRHVDGADASIPPGVIYRLPRRDSIQNLEALDFVTGLIGLIHPEYGGAVWFPNYYKRHELERVGSLSDVEEELKQTGSTQLTLFTHPVVVDNERLKGWIEEALVRGGLIHASDYDNTRLARQRGGFVRPATNWVCTVPDRVEIAFEPRLQTHLFQPGIAIAERLVGVENSRGFHRIERFFFRHSSQQITEVSAQELWPSLETDPLFATLLRSSELYFGDYLAEHAVAADDREKGIVDRGFYC